MSGVWRNDGRTSRTAHPSLAGYCNLKLAIDDVPDLVVRVGVLMNPSSCLDSIIGKRHVRRMEEAPLPAFPRFLYAKSICVDEAHATIYEIALSYRSLD